MVDEQTAGRIRNGMQVNVPEFSGAPLVKVFAAPRELLAIASGWRGRWCSRCVMGYADAGPIASARRSASRHTVRSAYFLSSG